MFRDKKLSFIWYVVSCCFQLQIGNVPEVLMLSTEHIFSKFWIGLFYDYTWHIK